ncbi:hypothetical protein QQS21_002386 [Conoideocrella luteorostrata]|uniref:TATA element modulatory factor 1 TATA binding domain-containing protein n=1 Tax=Conoideocrella luteorostrata TaxID=1105319 RepID=A0AAJ0CVA8_9HYPO|nr:hypothetical protein QQS21_002386 [Conoideocrella luteorostrata]
MAAPGKSSKWGSFLSQAVAGVESRLDNMLADPEEARSHDLTGATPSHATTPKTTTPTSATTMKHQQLPQQLAPPKKSSASNSRSSSSTRVNDRLQARLAQAMTGKTNVSGAANRGTPSPRSSVDQASRPSIERHSTDKEVEVTKDGAPSEHGSDINDPTSTIEPSNNSETVFPIDASAQQSTSKPVLAPKETCSEGSPLPAQASHHSGEPRPNEEQHLMPASSTTAADNSERSKQLQEANEKQQDEIREYVERIDSLQSKLQYLAKTATDAAKKAALSAPSGSVEQKLAERDEKIALLMEEGQKLSNNEHKLRMTIKNLRAQIGDNRKQMEELKKNRDKALSNADALSARLNGSEDVERRQEEAKRATATLQKEIDALKRDIAKKDDISRRLEQEWKSKLEQTEISHRDAMNKALTGERQKLKTVEELNLSLRAEKKTAIEKARQDEIEWREKLGRTNERGRKTEEELKLELHAVEGKLEAMRVTAEEASSGSGGEAQVKMFRQVETLQSQYASARENWQGIESSLIAKSANLEKERDEAQRRESAMRKKAREAAVRLRHLEDELQDVQPSLLATRQELEASRDELAELQASYRTSQAALEETIEELEKARQCVTYREDSIDAERRQWVDEVTGTASRGHQSRPESPLLSVSRTFSSELIGLSGTGKSRRSYPPSSIPDSPAEIFPPTRRMTSQPPLRTREPSYAGSGPPPTPFSPFEPPSETGQFPSSAAVERENGILETIPSSPLHVAQDMVSVSTVAAGPSVQLVERMSAAIRRLEAEKVTAKEEMVRVYSQRDEARTDLVALMKEIEATKASAAKVPQLEEEVANIDARYQTTLEMLGEKSELVEELRADVDDVKAMYRELVERTVK